MLAIDSDPIKVPATLGGRFDFDGTVLESPLQTQSEFQAQFHARLVGNRRNAYPERDCDAPEHQASRSSDRIAISR